MAGAVPRRDGPRDPPPVGALVPARPARPGRPQEPAAAGCPARARRPRPAPALHRQPGLGRRALAPGPGREGGRAGRRPGGGAGDRRHRPAEEGRALGRRGPPVLRLPRQAGGLPGPGLAHPGPGRGAAADRAAAVPAGHVSRRPGALRPGRRALPKPDLALAEIDRVTAAGARFGRVLADAGYGAGAAFRRGLDERGLHWAVGVLKVQNVYPATVELLWPKAARGRPRKRPVPSEAPVAAEAMLAGAAWRRISWRHGTKGPLAAEFAALRVRPAEGERLRDGRHLPGDEVWLVGEHRASGERKYYLSNLPAATPLEELAATIKARWVCEQAHQQLKEELGLDHFEGRSWTGLHRHALMTMIAFAFLQHLRLGARGKKRRRPPPRAAASAEPARGAAHAHRAALARLDLLPALRLPARVAPAR